MDGCMDEMKLKFQMGSKSLKVIKSSILPMYYHELILCEQLV